MDSFGLRQATDYPWWLWHSSVQDTANSHVMGAVYGDATQTPKQFAQQVKVMGDRPLL